MTKFRSTLLQKLATLLPKPATLLPKTATMSKQHSTLSKGRNFTINSFDIVAVFGNKVKCCRQEHISLLHLIQESPLPLTDPCDGVAQRMLNIPYRIIMVIKPFNLGLLGLAAEYRSRRWVWSTVVQRLSEVYDIHRRIKLTAPETISVPEILLVPTKI